MILYDAAIFGGDAFHEPGAIADMIAYLERWQRGLNETKNWLYPDDETWLERLNEDLETDPYTLLHLPSGVYAVRDLDCHRIILRRVDGVQYNFNQPLDSGKMPSDHRLKNEANWTEMNFE